MNKQVLLINDLAGYGKVSLAAMIPVLTHMGVNVHNLPTAVVSNTLDYGKFSILDTTEFMKKALAVWKELGFSFDAVSTGFIVNREQAEIVTAFCREQKEKGVMVLCDPIMGDDGILYPGVEEDAVENMRVMVSNSDYILPNYTEAAFLTGNPYQESVTEEEIRKMVDQLRDMGARSVIVTSVIIDHSHQVYCYDHREERYFSIPFAHIPVRFPGTGDIFSAVLLGGIMRGDNLETSVSRAMKAVRAMIAENQDNEDKFRGINIADCLEDIE